MPEVYRDANGHPYFRTKGGAQVSIMEDELGNIFMKDPGGNIYYDTGDQKLGVYLVRSRRCMTIFQGEISSRKNPIRDGIIFLHQCLTRQRGICNQSSG